MATLAIGLLLAGVASRLSGTHRGPSPILNVGSANLHDGETVGEANAALAQHPICHQTLWLHPYKGFGSARVGGVACGRSKLLVISFTGTDERPNRFLSTAVWMPPERRLPPLSEPAKMAFQEGLLSAIMAPFEVIDRPGELAVVAARHDAKSAVAVYQGRRNAYNFAALAGDGRVLYVVTLIQRTKTAEAVRKARLHGARR